MHRVSHELFCICKFISKNIRCSAFRLVLDIAPKILVYGRARGSLFLAGWVIRILRWLARRGPRTVMGYEIRVTLRGLRLEDILEILPSATVRNKAVTMVFACLLGCILQFLMVIPESSFAFRLKRRLSFFRHHPYAFLVLGSWAIRGWETFTIIFFRPLRKQRVFTIRDVRRTAC